ncbi:MAG: GNAT family N-acetyltransferase [Bacteroidetes bacterium]|nr:GNAT family N-acetyltransferase [Bacteroidota bacterium]
MLIRRATIKDIPRLSVLFDLYRIFYKKESDINGAKKFLEERILNNESIIFVAEEENLLLGFTQLYPLFSSTRMKRSWVLNDLFVLREHRGKGISKQLIDQAKEIAKETQAAGVALETEKTNLIGNNLYPSSGFVLNTENNFYWWSNE